MDREFPAKWPGLPNPYELGSLIGGLLPTEPKSLPVGRRAGLYDARLLAAVSSIPTLRIQNGWNVVTFSPDSRAAHHEFRAVFIWRVRADLANTTSGLLCS